MSLVKNLHREFDGFSFGDHSHGLAVLGPVTIKIAGNSFLKILGLAYVN